jgi:heme A synthase
VSASTQSFSGTTAVYAGDRSRPRAVAIWLFVCCALVFAMAVVGGATRLTHSGLSITEWQPIVGTLPPLSPAAWDEAFRKYQATPEYREVNRDMTIDAFKGIFWWEYFHRLLGRAIGVVFLVPLVGFGLRGRIPPRFTPMLIGIFFLGAAQGALGWYMVQSGLIDDPRVSQLRLAAHLGLALLIFAAMLWLALSLVRPARASADARLDRLFRAASALAALVFVMALTGALVAGLRAGAAYNTFPLMNGHVVPPDAAPTVVSEFRRQHGHRAIRSPGDRVGAGDRRPSVLVAPAVGARGARGVPTGRCAAAGRADPAGGAGHLDAAPGRAAAARGRAPGGRGAALCGGDQRRACAAMTEGRRRICFRIALGR